METKCTQQEILLFTNTSFSHREFADKNNPDRNRIFTSAIDQLKEGCWNGLLGDILPEIVKKTEEGKQLFLWNVYEGECFLGIELSEQLVVPEAEFSINPDAFLSAVQYS